VPLIDGGTQRLPRIVGLGRALDLILSGRIVSADEALGWGMLTEIAAEPLDRALELAQQLASFPQDTMIADRWGAIEGLGLALADGLELEARTGTPTVLTGVQGAGRFAAGEGRGGAGVSRPPI
jgi:enoyl-CoA hydratase